MSATNQICRGLVFFFPDHCAQVVLVNGVLGGKEKVLEGTIWGAADTTNCSNSVRFWLSIYNLKLWLGCNKCSWYSNYFQSWADSKLWIIYMHIFTHGNSEICTQKSVQALYKCSGRSLKWDADHPLQNIHTCLFMNYTHLKQKRVKNMRKTFKLSCTSCVKFVNCVVLLLAALILTRSIL